ncbi:DUF3040 domain-containing protein [Actinomycetospora lutea]|uniref:DUF3040 domain-containing protein n=1 Tax=Actinomycetospora lutea TaxID=663604 RepID=UPI0023672149|nr:DUF3040 domain-containing protein [Actinomycetospora lutea]MDD7940533.1 DUF3040 domain-containing protein [Actinomycetospora lutea]
MPLSEHEQRLLEQIERALYDEDPKFASTVRGGKLRRPSRRRRIQGVALFVIGVVALVLGVVLFSTSTAGIIVSVAGFLAMFGGAVLAITSFGARKKEAAAEGDAAQSAAGEKERSRFTSRMEERFRRRFEQE